MAKSNPMQAGEVFGRLTAVEFIERVKGKYSRWRFKCSCGNEHIASDASVRQGNCRSCGCLAKENCSRIAKIHAPTHGMSKKPVYRVWAIMLSRCKNPNNARYYRYGARGISVCERWKKFENFYEDMGEPPPGLSLDRIDNDGNYEPGNCRWATRAMQQRNRANNRFVVIDGKRSILTDAAREAGMNITTFRKRMGL